MSEITEEPQVVIQNDKKRSADVAELDPIQEQLETKKPKLIDLDEVPLTGPLYMFVLNSIDDSSTCCTPHKFVVWGLEEVGALQDFLALKDNSDRDMEDHDAYVRPKHPLYHLFKAAGAGVHANKDNIEPKIGFKEVEEGQDVAYLKSGRLQDWVMFSIFY